MNRTILVIVLLKRNLLVLTILLYLKKLYEIINDSKFNVGDRVRLSKYKTTVSKDYSRNWLRELFVTDSVLNTNPWTYTIKDLNGEKKLGSFYENKIVAE